MTSSALPSKLKRPLVRAAAVVALATAALSWPSAAAAQLARVGGWSVTSTWPAHARHGHGLRSSPRPVPGGGRKRPHLRGLRQRGRHPGDRSLPGHGREPRLGTLSARRIQPGRHGRARVAFLSLGTTTSAMSIVCSVAWYGLRVPAVWCPRFNSFRMARRAAAGGSAGPAMAYSGAEP